MSTKHEEILTDARRFATHKASKMLPETERQDAIALAVARVWKRLPTMDPSREPWPLVTRIVYQTIAMEARAYYAKTDVLTGDDRDFDHLTSPSAEDTYLATLEPEAEAVSPPLEAALVLLTDRQREVVRLTIMEGRTNVAVASILGTSEANVRQIRKVAVDAMRAIMSATA